MLGSMVCKYEDFLTDWYRRWAQALYQEPVGFDALSRDRFLHRKYWEYNAIAQALEERGMLTDGKKGCGFAVGREPLPSLFASYGAEILATDLPADVTAEHTATAADWASSGDHATSLEALHEGRIISREDLFRKVRFTPVDMRNLGLPWTERFDFLWSSCSIEHLGSLQAGLDFVKQSLSILRPGGFAVHTTEFNVSSNHETIVDGPSVIYRKCDIEQLDYELRRMRCGLTRCDFYAGDAPADIEFDADPFNGKQNLTHIKLALGGHVATSMMMIIRKGGS